MALLLPFFPFFPGLSFVCLILFFNRSHLFQKFFHRSLQRRQFSGLLLYHGIQFLMDIHQFADGNFPFRSRAFRSGRLLRRNFLSFFFLHDLRGICLVRYFCDPVWLYII